ncbi:MAG TPA: helix-turn-helix domain-containing protein [Thermoleophilia bacterium]|nr:helix-turn-helix domain-containing protein [Thermoleophilia bacterium]
MTSNDPSERQSNHSILTVDETLDVTNALGDPTRFGIYRTIVDAAGEAVTVSDVAATFSLHPNVARMHLQKLVDVGLVEVDSRKSPTGGRPARIYRLGDRVADIHFPPRDYRLLAGLALKVVETLAAEEPEVLERTGYEMGREQAREALRRPRPPQSQDPDAMVSELRDLCSSLGLYPRIERSDGGRLEIEIRNCVFKELSSRHPDLVCTLHTAMLKGILESFIEEFEVEASPAISAGQRACRFAVTGSLKPPGAA